MGNVFSTDLARGDATANVTGESETMSDACASYEDAEEFHDTIDDDEARVKAKEEEMIEFRKQLDIKRKQRKIILARHRAEKEKLEESLEDERKSNMELKNKNRMLHELLVKNNIEIPENLTSNDLTELTGAIAGMKEEFKKLRSNNNKLRGELAETSVSLQNAYSDIADLNAQNIESMKHINALKDVITVSKTMITLREQQLIELKNKLGEIEQSLADREANMLSADLKQEYERQLQNIRTLRGLYEERARLAEVTRQSLVREVEEQKSLKEVEIKKNEDLLSKIAELEATVNTLEESIDNKKEQITSYQDETRGLQEEMTAVNTLFSQVLLGYKTKQDLDKLVHRLEENHGILTHMAEREHGSEASSALPKLLLEIVSQVDESENKNQIVAGIQDVIREESNDDEHMKLAASAIETQNPSNTSAEEIVQNLPKVWRVLMELLSHQSEADAVTSEKVETCYKTVETKAGSVLVPSVSQTYIRLKDLILEKLALIKEVNRMKQLNGHLETRLGEQERRLSLVTTELSKTWHVVGRLRRHHHQLHTHEKILKYELQQKRKLLNELKDELEYCREKWQQAREKNSQSERDWRKLRAEFTSRKNSPAFNNSGESGYSDERPSDDSSESNDESEYVTEPKLRYKKKNKKSVEAVLDSSADFNLVAEREDPVSDMLDVAELPLDTQDDTSGLEVSVSNNSDNVPKNAEPSEETEDEVGEITNDSCNDDSSGVEHYCNSDYCCVGTSVDQDGPSDTKLMSPDNKSKQTSSDTPIIDSVAILKSIREQTERLAKKDEKLNNLEKNSVKLLKKTKETDKLSKQIDSVLEHLLNRPTTSQRQGTEEPTLITDDAPVLKIDDIKYNDQPQNDDSAINTANEPVTELEACDKTILTTVSNDFVKQMNFGAHENTESNLFETNENTCIPDLVNSSPPSSDTPNNLPVINASSILESIKQQNERLAKRDERLQRLEKDCSDVMTSVSNVVKVSEDITAKLDDLHDKHGNGSEEAGPSEFNVTPESRGTPEPSTSTEIDHEARFAARDIRLKRLEEQTKSLVNRVNKTTSKGVKIHYKLEELHNIYGSESSRAGTPSDENEEKPQSNEDNVEE